MTSQDHLGRSGHTSAGHGSSAPDACSVLFDAHDVSAFGSAAQAFFWVAVEQAGPWGRVAATESHLPSDVGRGLDDECSRRGGRLALVRAPGPHPDTRHSGGRTAYLAFSGAEPWLLRARDVTLDELASLDLDALAAGDREAVRTSLPRAEATDPILLVCTNGRRDVCCALRGRPVALEAAAARPGRVWESSHTGGHRFAPTGVLLPFGMTVARLDAALCDRLLEEADRGRLPAEALGPRHDRGRSALAPAAQAAESFVRQHTGETGLTALRSVQVGEARPAVGASPAGAPLVEVQRPADNSRWRIEAVSEDSGSQLPESCAKGAVPLRQWRPRFA